MASGKARRYPAAICFISVVFAIFAFACAGSAHSDELHTESVSVGAGYRVDKFSWNIAGNSSGTNPDILSELTWKDIGIFDMRAVYRSDLNNGLRFRGSLGYGVIFRGRNRDSDYNGNGRTQEFSRSNNRADSGSVWDTSAGLGYKLTRSFTGAAIEVIPMAGYAIYQQNLRITDGFQTIPATGSFGGLNSSYTARWFGPWAGAEGAYKSGKLTVKGGLEYHAIGYSASADWNLRTDFQHPNSFDHSASGYGVVATGGADYALSKSWSADGDIHMHKFRASNGVDTTHFADGTSASTKLNEVRWDSIGIMAGLKYSF
ncbi:MAG: TonB-dependent receptor [Deltaproteobacteria bacterium]|nr:TonB-dependent receptor [Deltaproteobacteria bacterium]